MLNMIDIGERAGSGIPNIFRVWHDQGWQEPRITQSFSPDRITLSLAFISTDDKKVLINSADKKDDKKALMKSAAQKEEIIAYLTDHPRAAASELCELLGVKPTRVRTLLRELIAEEIVIAEGGNRNRTYRLKA